MVLPSGHPNQAAGTGDLHRLRAHIAHAEDPQKKVALGKDHKVKFYDSKNFFVIPAKKEMVTPVEPSERRRKLF